MYYVRGVLLLLLQILLINFFYANVNRFVYPNFIPMLRSYVYDPVESNTLCLFFQFSFHEWSCGLEFPLLLHTHDECADGRRLYRCFSYHLFFFRSSEYSFNLRARTIPLRRSFLHSSSCCINRPQPVIFYEGRTFSTNDHLFYSMS